jgi:hypothetical protein
VFNFLKLFLLRCLPGFSKAAYRWKRLLEDQAYWSSSSPGFGPSSNLQGAHKAQRVLVVLPPLQDCSTEFAPGSGNFYYEILRSAQERYGRENVGSIFVSSDTPWERECAKIAEKVAVESFSHLLFYIESIEVKSNIWRWDILGSELIRVDSRVTAIGFLTDGTYDLHQLQCSRFQEVYSNSIFIQIDVAPSHKYVKDKRVFGPTFLPISQESIQHIREYRSVSTTESYGLSFVGRIHGYRRKVIRDLTESGVSVAVNPHRSSNSDDNPSYLEYMDALRRSRITINFSRSNGTRKKQLKSRILESTLVGSVPLTDDGGLSELVLPAEVPLLKFSNTVDIGNVLHDFQGTWDIKVSASFEGSEQMAVIEKAASNLFWECLEQGLEKSSMALLGRAPLRPEN